VNLIWLMAVSLLSLSFVRVFVGYDRAGNFLLRLQEFWVEFKWIYMNFGSFFGPAVPLFHFFFPSNCSGSKSCSNLGFVWPG